MDRVRGIELLVRAVDAGSFARAARSLDVTPSALSHAIAELEKELGVALLYRTTRQLRLTADGEEIYQRGCDILRQLAELDSHLRGARERVAGTLRVGLPVALSRHVVMPMLPIFLRRHPGLQLQFHVVWQPHEMHAEGIDLLLRVGEPPESNLVARQIAEILPAPYAAPAYLKLAGTPENPGDLVRHRCLVLKVPWMNKPVDEWTFERGGERQTVTVAPSVVTYDREGLIEAVMAGAGVMWLGCFDPALLSSGRLRRILPDWRCPAGFPVYAMYRRAGRMPARLSAFLEFVTEAFTAFDPQEITLVHGAGSEQRARRASPVSARKA